MTTALAKPTTGTPAWILIGVQAALLAVATVGCFRATSHQQGWMMAAAAAAFAVWALIRPDSPATTGWILTVGAWWLTGLASPSLTTTLQTALLVLAAHYVTATRASTHHSTRLSLRYSATCLAALAALMLATTLTAALINAITNSPVTSDQWTIAWTTAATAALGGLTLWYTSTRAHQ